MITIIHNPDCSKSNCSLEYLQNLNEEILIRDYLAMPLSKKELSEIVHMLGMEAHELLRKKEPLYKSLIENRSFTNNEILQLMADNPILIERPVIIKNGKAVIGRPIEKVVDFVK